MNLRIRSILLLLLVVLFSTGCARFGTVFNHQTLQGDYSVYSFDGELQNTYVKKSRHGYRVCAGPTPDAVKTMSEGVEFEDPRIGEDVGAQNSTGAVGLGGRNPEVLIARELMYRACELSLNIDADYKQTRNIYRETLAAIQAIAKVQNVVGTQAIVANAVSAALPTHSDSGDDSDSDDDSTDSDDDTDADSDDDTDTDSDTDSDTDYSDDS